MNIIDKLNTMIGEGCSILGKKRKKTEAITTASSGVLDGPIADVQNGLLITQKDAEAIKKNKELLRSVMFKRVNEKSGISVDDIIDALDIPSFKKKFGNNFDKIWNEIQPKLQSLKTQLHITLTNKEIEELKNKIKAV